MSPEEFRALLYVLVFFTLLTTDIYFAQYYFQRRYLARRESL